jgi:Tol biopolymer transport system component
MQKTCTKRNPTPRRIAVALTLFSSSGLLVLLSFATSSSPSPYSRPGVTVKMLAANAGSDRSIAPVAVSGDGRYVAFSGGIGPSACCVVGVYDRQTGVTDTPAGSTGNGTIALSADGRYLAYSKPFYSSQDVFVVDRQTGRDTAISVAPDGSPPTCSSPGCVFSSWYPSISADGRYISFASFATNLIAGDTQSNSNPDVFVHEMQTGVTQRVSVASDGTQANGLSYENTISADGRYVAFRSYATNLVTGNTNSGSSATCTLQGQTSTTSDVYVHDRQTGTTELVSVGMNGTQDGCSWSPSISGDGRYVAFVSSATNLIPSDSDSAWDVYVRDRQTGRTERVSVTPNGAQGTCAPSSCRCGVPSISADGRYVAFHTFQSLVSDDVNQTGDIYIHDRETGNTERVSLAYPGEQVPGEPPGNANSTSGLDAFKLPAVSGDGRIIVFDSVAADLVQTDNWNNPNNNISQVFFRDRGPALGIGALNAACNASPATASGWATFSGTVISSADDSSSDAAPGAAQLGAELTKASLVYRPELGDLLVRFQVTSLPPQTGGAPGVLYGFQFQITDVKYEARATAVDMTSPYFALYSCGASPCNKVASVGGSMGTTGKEVQISVPMAVLQADYPSGANEGAPLTNLSAYTALGTATSGPGEMLDSVALPSTDVPVHTVALGIAPAGTPQANVSFDTPATLAAGFFSGNLPLVAAGSYDVWAKACLDNNCGATSVPLTVSAACAAPPVQLLTVVSRMTHGGIIMPPYFDVPLPLSGSRGVECRSSAALGAGNYTMVFNFANPLTSVASVSASATGTTQPGSTGLIDSNDAHNYIVNLTDAPNAQYITVTLSSVTDSVGEFSSAVSATMGVLLGDVNGDGQVDSGDLIAVKQQTLQPVNDNPGTSNFREDVNTDGNIDSSDLIITKRQTLTGLPTPP